MALGDAINPLLYGAGIGVDVEGVEWAERSEAAADKLRRFTAWERRCAPLPTRLLLE